MQAGSDRGTRITGFVLFLISAGLGYWQVLSPIIQAANGAPRISYSVKAAVVAPIGALFGLFLLVFGAEGLVVLQRPPSKPLMIVLMVATLAYTLGCIFLMAQIMKAFGYS